MVYIARIAIFRAQSLNLFRIFFFLNTLKNLAEAIEDDVGMVFLKYQSWAESNGNFPTATGLNAVQLECADNLISHLGVGAVDCQEGSTTAGGVQDMREFLLQAQQTVLQNLAGHVDIGQELLLLDDLHDFLEQEDLARIAHPGVEDPVRLIRNEVVVVEVATQLQLLAEGHHIGRTLQLEVLVGPEFSSATSTGLDLIDQKGDAILLANSLEAPKELGRCLVVASFALNRFNDDSGNRILAGVLLNEILHFAKALFVLLLVVRHVFVQGISILGKRGNGPVERWNVQLMDVLRMCGGQGSQCSPMEGSLE